MTFFIGFLASFLFHINFSLNIEAFFFFKVVSIGQGTLSLLENTITNSGHSASSSGHNYCLIL